LCLVLALVLLVSAACKRTNSTATKSNVTSGIQVTEQRFQPPYLTSRIKFRYQDPEQSFSGTASLRMVRDSALWVSVSAILGLEAARVLFLPDEVRFHNRLEGTRETYTYQQFKQWTGMELTLPMVQHIILGNNPFPTQPIQQRANGDTTWYRYDSGQAAIIGSIQKLVRLQATAPNGAGATAVAFDVFKPAVSASPNESQFPTKKEVRVRNDNGLLSIDLDHVKVEVPTERPETPW